MSIRADARYFRVSRKQLARMRECSDCRIDIYDIGHYYMVEDAVWAAAGLVSKDHRSRVNDAKLCLPCLEARLGRLLRYEDFKPNTNSGLWHGKARMLPDGWTEHVLARRRI
jgi:hypothetical protein